MCLQNTRVFVGILPTWPGRGGRGMAKNVSSGAMTKAAAHSPARPPPPPPPPPAPPQQQRNTLCSYVACGRSDSMSHMPYGCGLTMEGKGRAGKGRALCVWLLSELNDRRHRT